jgi:hypothetical protein
VFDEHRIEALAYPTWDAWGRGGAAARPTAAERVHRFCDGPPAFTTDGAPIGLSVGPAWWMPPLALAYAHEQAVHLTAPVADHATVGERQAPRPVAHGGG